MAGILNFSNYIGGADSIQLQQIFPSNQRVLRYTFGETVTGWTFALDHQTLVVDPVTFDRNTGEPNFATSQVIGYFPKVDLTTTTAVVNVVNANTGVVDITVPANLYTGPILPDARSRVPVTVFAVTWTKPSSNPNATETFTHRWAFIQSYEPDVPIGDPTTSTNPLYTAISI